MDIEGTVKGQASKYFEDLWKNPKDKNPFTDLGWLQFTSCSRHYIDYLLSDIRLLGFPYEDAQILAMGISVRMRLEVWDDVERVKKLNQLKKENIRNITEKEVQSRPKEEVIDEVVSRYGPEDDYFDIRCALAVELIKAGHGELCSLPPEKLDALEETKKGNLKDYFRKCDSFNGFN